MKVQRKLGVGTIVEAEGQTVAEVFEAIGSLEEIFSGYDSCGACGKAPTRYNCRQDKEGNKYFHVQCMSCKAEFRFGQKKGPGGHLFPQLKDKDGNYKPNNGWVKWNAHE